MSARFIYNTSGQYVAFVVNNNVFSPDATWLGFIRAGNEVYSAANGAFLGHLTSDDRIVRNTSEYPKPMVLRPFPPFRPLVPLRPLKRLGMPRLPPGYVDVFATAGGSASTQDVSDLDELEGTELRGADGQPLGNVSHNRFDSDSLTNAFGRYGSRYNAGSIFNPYGQYGSKYSALSPFNKFSSTPPAFYRGDRRIAYLTVNQFLKPRVEPERFLAWLGKE